MTPRAVTGDDLRLRAATGEDLRFLVALAGDPSVEPFLAPGSGDRETIAGLLARMASGEEPLGLMVVESEAGARLGALELSLVSRHSRICQLRRLMVDPGRRRTGVGSAAVWLACRQSFQEHGHHRVQAEVYGDNHASLRLFERLGFTREGIRRSAYWRRERWQDGILFGLLEGELVGPRPPAGSA